MKNTTGMVHIGILALGALAAGPLFAAPAWEAADGHWRWQGRDLAVHFEPPGIIRVLQGDREAANLAFFQWHDQWVYERLERGTVDAPAQTAADGVLRQTGSWGTTAPAPALAYTLSLVPKADGVDLELQVRKTAPLKLTYGIQAVLSVPRQPDDGRLAIAEPARHAPLGQTLDGAFRRLLIGRPGEAALALAPAGVGGLRGRVADTYQSFELALHRRDFDLGETLTVSLSLRETTMPAPPPDPAPPQRAPLAIRGLGPLPATVAQFDVLEIAVDLTGTWDNPFDPAEIRLDAHVTTAEGQTYIQPGFFMVPHERQVDHGLEFLLPTGPGLWRVRLATPVIGPLRGELRATDRSGTVTYPLPQVEVTPSALPGFVRVSPVDPRYLAFDNGTPYVPIGHNLPIYPTGGQLVDEAIAKMAAAGENWNRWWLSNGGLGLEWERTLGRYRQPQAARLDYALELARRHGLVYMICMDTHQDFRDPGWKANPFNAANGGPCQTPADWFTDDRAKALYRQRLRYTVARWSASPQVLCWEFGNEFEGWAQTPQDTIIAWHREMAAFLRDLDPYRHPITTSWWGKTGPEACWSIPDIDIVQTHCYTNNDQNVADQIREYCLKQWKTFNKPHIFGEFGIRSHESTADKDPKGWGLHNAFWSAVASGCDGIPMPWWHENYIDPLNLYPHFTAIRRFTADLPFGTLPWRQVETEAVYAGTVTAPPRRDAILTPAEGFRRPTVTDFVLAPDGTVNDPGELLALLHGDGHADLRAPPVFTVTYPAPGVFGITVERVSNSGHLHVYLDDAEVLAREFPCGENHGKSWQHRPQWNLWESTYNEEVTIPVPAGVHRLRVENTGKDWIRVKAFRFEGGRLVDRPNLLVAALTSDSHAIVWLQNRDSDWFQHGQGTVTTVPASRVTLRGLPNGPATLEWWETWEGAPRGPTPVSITQGQVTLEVPPLRTDVAATLRFSPQR